MTVGPGQLDRVVAGEWPSAGVQQRSAAVEVGDHPADGARPRVVENPHALLGQRKHHVPARAEGERVGKRSAGERQHDRGQHPLVQTALNARG